MVLELAYAGMMACHLYKSEVIEEMRYCNFLCPNKLEETASTSVEFYCPETIYVDIPERPDPPKRIKKKPSKPYPRGVPKWFY